MKKKTIMIIGIIVVLVMGMGVSFAYWMMNVNQKDKNRITSECFKLTMEGTEGISLEKAYPITNEEGESLDPYTFTIENICETTAAYQVNLEQMETEKDISGKYIKVELDNKEPKNYDKYDETEITLKENGKEARKLTTGILRPSEKVSYSIRLWMDEKTPAISEVMNASFKSKVTVIASYLKKEEVPPEVAIQISRCSNNITAKIEATGNKIESYEYQIDEEEVVSKQESTHTFSDTSRGETHTIKVKVTDEYGNETTKEERIKIPNYPTLLGKQIGEDIKVVTEGEGLYEVTHCNETIENDELSEEAKEGFLLEEYRYAGSNPDNYITFNNETWRIIGLVNVLTTNGTVEQRVKIIRNESIGQYSWDTSPSDINNGYGVNEWSQADLMKLLNPGYEENQDKDSNGSNITVNNSLYWTGGSGNCYNGQKNGSTTCNFTNGLSDVNTYIANDIIWNLGNYTANNIYVSDYYEYERGENMGKLCSKDSIHPDIPDQYSCNDEIKRKSNWQGKIALMYVSDYDYSIGNNVRDSCLNTNLWAQPQDCAYNSWIFIKNLARGQLTLNSSSDQNAAWNILFLSNQEKKIYRSSASVYADVFPSLYLQKDVTIMGDGIGSEPSPYTLTMTE